MILIDLNKALIAYCMINIYKSVPNVHKLDTGFLCSRNS